MLKAYSQMGYHALAVSRDSAEGMQGLLDLLQDKSVAFVGASGVGKSSLIKFLLPDRDVREGAISAATGFGSHTTSVTYWYEMGQGSIIDSPGVRHNCTQQSEDFVDNESIVDSNSSVQETQGRSNGCYYNEDTLENSK